MRPSLIAALLCVAPAVAHAESERVGVWTLNAEPSSSGRGGIVTALSQAPSADLGDPAYVIARCLGGRSEFLVGGQGDWGVPRRKLDVTVGIAGGASETSKWDVSTNGRAVFLDDGVEAFMKRLPDDGKLRVAVRDGLGVTRENIFALTGFGTVRAKIAAACGWPGEAAPRG